MFKFRFESILKIKKYKEDTLKQKFASLIYAYNYQEAIVTHIKAEKERYILELEDMLSVGKDISIERLLLYISFLNELKERISEEEKVLSNIKIEKEKVREALISAQREKRLFEILQDKEYEAYIKEEAYKYQNFLDEVGLNLFRNKII